MACLLLAAPAWAQLGTLASPGPLAQAHADLQGLSRCSACHAPGHQVTASKCLSCHKPIGERIARKTGVHRNVTTDCTSCHVEHAGIDGDLRRFDTRAFDHAVETGFPLEGQHGKLATKCAACHTRRSFLDARPACGSCHTDVHKGTLGNECSSCHSTLVPFKQARRQFDHGRSRFLLTGAHRAVACEKCHVAGIYRGLRFETCASCHRAPHRSLLGPSCTSCHGTDRWTTRIVDHSRTRFTLLGQHARVACEQCHTSGITRALQFDRCSACHVNVHRDSLKEDCGTCHTETSFRGSRFDHGPRTTFPLEGKHEGLACRKCHTTISAENVPLASKNVDFGGVSAACAACHTDEHKGEYGRLCDACHRPTGFKTTGFVHPRSPEFFAGRHAGVTCARCHVRAADLQPVRTAAPPPASRATVPAMTCGACHADVHLGQVGAACERCHVIDAARFAAARFSHDSAAFPLTGKHRIVDCAKCHPMQTSAFPAGTGAARRLKPLSAECRVCHQDPHLAQVDARCTSCHTTESFILLAYQHVDRGYLFGVASHARLPCRSCHKKETGVFPAGRGTAVRFKGLGRTCLDCHP